MTTVAVGLASLALVLGLRRFAPAVPGSLVAVLVGIAAAGLLDLDHHGVEIVGQIDRGRRGIYGIAARPDFIAAVAAPAGVLVFDTLPGLFIGIVVSLLLLLYRASRPHVAVLGQVPGTPGQYGDIQRHPENELEPGVALLRVEGGLFFASADTVRAAVLAHAAEPGARTVVLDPETAPSSTSAPPACSSSSPTTCGARGSSWCSPAASARSARSCAGPTPRPPCPGLPERPGRGGGAQRRVPARRPGITRPAVRPVHPRPPDAGPATTS